MSHFTRWPLALLCFGLIGVAVGLDLATDAARQLALSCEVLGIACGGAFLYAEGARHREWLDQLHDRDTPDDTPDAGQPPGQSA